MVEICNSGGTPRLYGLPNVERNIKDGPEMDQSSTTRYTRFHSERFETGCGTAAGSTAEFYTRYTELSTPFSKYTEDPPHTSSKVELGGHRAFHRCTTTLHSHCEYMFRVIEDETRAGRLVCFFCNFLIFDTFKSNFNA